MLVQTGVAHKPEETILVLGSREEGDSQASVDISKHGWRRYLRSRAGWIKTLESATLVPPGITRGMVFHSAQPFGVITDGQSVHLESGCTVSSINSVW